MRDEGQRGNADGIDGEATDKGPDAPERSTAAKSSASRAGWLKPGVVGAVAALVVGGGAWGLSALRGGGDATPGESPQPTGSVGPSLTASVSPSVSAPPPESTIISISTPGEVTVDPTLPTALPLPDGIWDEVGDGWVLAGYAPAIDTNPAEHYVLYLVSPEGERYQVLELDPDAMWQVVGWEGGHSPALMSRAVEGTTHWTREWGFLDLDSGRLTPIEVEGMDEEYVLGVNANDEYVMYDYSTSKSFIVLRDRDLTAVGALDQEGHLWSPNGLWWITSEDYIGLDEGLSISSLVGDDGYELALDLPADPGICSLVGWVDDGHLLVVCQQLAQSNSDEATNLGTTFLSYPIDGDGEYEVLVEALVPQRGFGRAEVVNDTIVALDGEGLTVIRDGEATRIPSSAYGADMWGPYPMTVVGTRVYVKWGIPDDTEAAPYLSVDDIAAGTSTLLVPPYVPGGDAWVTSAMVFCVIVGGHETLSY